MKSQENFDATPDVKSAPMYESKENGEVNLALTESNREGVVIEETTHRGLKARHAQMIALGGTIGARKTFKSCHQCRSNSPQVLVSLLEVELPLPKVDLYLSFLAIHSWLCVYWVSLLPLLRWLLTFQSVEAQ